MIRCSIEPRTRKYVKIYEFLSFPSLSVKCWKKLVDVATKTGTQPLIFGTYPPHSPYMHT